MADHKVNTENSSVGSLDPFLPRQSLMRSPPPEARNRIRSPSVQRQTSSSQKSASQANRNDVTGAGTSGKRPADSPNQSENPKRQELETTQQQQEKKVDFFQIVSDLYNTIAKEKGMKQDKKDQIHEALGVLSSLYNDVSKQNCTLQTELKLSKQTRITTYAQTAAKVTLPKEQPKVPKQNKHTVFVSANGMDAKEVRKVFTENVYPVRDKIKINKLTTTAKLLIVETESAEDVQKLTNLESLKAINVKVDPPKKRNPLMIIYDIPSSSTNEEIVDTIYAQNFEDIMTKDQFNTHFKLRFKTGPKDRRTFHYVVEVKAKLRNEARKRGKVFMGFTAHNIKDYTVVARCLRCQDLGHVKKYCKHEKTVCSHCGEEDQLKAECEKRRQSPTCIPCKLRNKTCTANKKDCPTYQLMLERLISRIDYGDS